MKRIDFDDFWVVGTVRIRAKAFDPYAGLRGRAYIQARQLDQNRVQRIDASATATAKSESRKNLINALNPVRDEPSDLQKSPLSNFVFISGSHFNSGTDRRFYVMPTPKARKA